MATAHPFRRPILSSIYRIAGALSIVGAVLVLVGAVFGATKGIGAEAAIVAFGLAIGSAVVCCGIAEILDCIARTAHHTEQIATLIAAHLSRQAGTPPRATRAPAPDAPRLTDLAGSTTASCPSCMAELDVRSLRPGRNTCPSCRVEFVAE